MIEQIAKQLHEGKLKPSDLNQELISKTYTDISKAAGNGYGKNWIQFTKDGKGSLPTELKKNIYAFSGAKTYAQLQELNNLLYDQDGKLRPFNEYMVYARKLNRQYNINWLQSEWQTARTAAQMAEKWERLQETKDLFPNLKYRTVGDDRVRDDHALLDGIIKPIDDPFWSKYYPPLDWRCRCDVVATAENTTTHKEKDLPEVNFKGNVAIDEEIFTKKGTFFKLANTSKNAKRNIELSKLNAPYETISKKAGYKLRVNIYADKTDLKDNIDTARIILKDIKINVDIRPHINIDNWKNPEYLINGVKADLKINFKKDNYDGIKRGFESAKNQDCKTVVFNFDKSFANLDITKVNRIIRGKVTPTRGKWLDEVILIYNDKAVNISREDIINNKLMLELEKLKADS